MPTQSSVLCICLLACFAAAALLCVALLALLCFAMFCCIACKLYFANVLIVWCMSVCGPKQSLIFLAFVPRFCGLVSEMAFSQNPALSCRLSAILNLPGDDEPEEQQGEIQRRLGNVGAGTPAAGGGTAEDDLSSSSSSSEVTS